jgi:division protein CdvB (Snf7/Vps24/ESCRT-III family)
MSFLRGLNALKAFGLIISFVRNKRTLPEILIDINLAITRIDNWISRLKTRSETLERLSYTNMGRFPLLSKEFLKEVEFNQAYTTKLVQIKVLLEILKIRIETIMLIGSITGYLKPIIDAIYEVKKEIGSSIEMSPLLDQIIEIVSPLEPLSSSNVVINDNEKVKEILEESRKIAEKEVRQKYKVPA